MKDISAEEEEETSSASDFILECFSDDMKQSDGRLWLPLHLAISVSSSRLEGIHTLSTVATKAYADETNQLNPCHLATTAKNSLTNIIVQSQKLYPGLISKLDCDSNTPLHLTARYLDIIVLQWCESWPNCTFLLRWK